MKNLSTGTGLCIVGLCAVAFPFAQKLASVEGQAHAGIHASAMTAVSSAATVQVTPTIVWYGMISAGDNIGNSGTNVIARAWSDGKVEAKLFRAQYVYGNPSSTPCGSFIGRYCTGWQVISDPTEGLAYRSDINFDEKVDARQDIPPSDCPLALINP